MHHYHQNFEFVVPPWVSNGHYYFNGYILLRAIKQLAIEGDNMDSTNKGLNGTANTSPPPFQNYCSRTKKAHCTPPGLTSRLVAAHGLVKRMNPVRCTA